MSAEIIGRIIAATGIEKAAVLPCFDRSGHAKGDVWDWVAEMPLYIPRGHRIVAEVSQEGVLNVWRERI